MKIYRYILYALFCYCFISCNMQKKTQLSSSKMLKALIIDGENNHGVWPKTTAMMKDYLEQTGLFEVDIERTKFTWQGPHYDKIEGVEDIETLLQMYPIDQATTAVKEPQPDPDFKPDFSKYDVVVSNMGWKASTWSEAARRDFETFIRNGGGLVVVHAANNSWADWQAYNQMIGLGGWSGRSEKDGPYVFYDDAGKLVRDTSVGTCGSHGPQHEFVITTRDTEHPITKDLPEKWLHAKDELYDRLRGPAENMTILATAYSDIEINNPTWNDDLKGTGRHEPVLMTINYGEGRIFHSILGHGDKAMECVGFMTTFQRGVEWSATGKVSQTIPKDFPKTDKVSVRGWGR